MKRKRINSIIKKSFFRDGKISVALVIIIIVCSIVVTGFSGLVLVTSERHQKEAEERYGSYQFGVKAINLEQAKEIAKKEFCDKSGIFVSEYIQHVKVGFYKMCVEQSYWDISDIKLVSGNIPKSSDEIVCNEELLITLGYGEDNIGGKIKIGHEEYILSGIIIDAGESNENIAVMSLDESNISNSNCAVLIKTCERNYGKLMESIQKEYGIESFNIFENYLVMKYSSKDIYGNYTGIMKIFHYISYLIIIPCVMLTVIVAIFYGRKIAPLCNQYMSMGISRIKLYFLFILHIFKIIVGLSFVMAGLVFGIVLAYLKSLHIMDAYILLSVLKEFATMILIYIAGSFGISAVVFWVNLSVRNGKRVEMKSAKVKKSIFLTGKENIYTQISMENMNFGSLRHLLVVVMLAVICAMASGTAYFINQYILSKSVTDKYDFYARFQYEDYAEEVEGSDENRIIYENMLKEKNITEVLPMYMCYEYAKVDKRKLDKDYLKYLSKTSDYYASAIISSSAKMRMPILLVKMDNSLLKKYGINYNIEELGENECIALKYTSAPGNNYGYETGIGTDTPLYFNFGSDGTLFRTEDEKFEVKAVLDTYDVSLFRDYYTQVIIVNSRQYQKFIPYDYPDFFFIKANDLGQASKLIEGSKRLKVIDFEKERKESVEYNQVVILTRNIIFILILNP